MKLISTLIAGATLAIAPAAMAQTAPQTTPAPTPAPAPAPTATAAVTSASVTDAELAKFVAAALEIEKIRKDTTVAEADKTAKMASAATTAGIDPVRFNAIGQAMSTDTALNARVQAEAAKQAPPAPAAPAAPAKP